MLLYKRHLGGDGVAVGMDLEADDNSEETAHGESGVYRQYFHANAMSVPPEMSEECKVDNVEFMLLDHYFIMFISNDSANRVCRCFLGYSTVLRRACILYYS